MVVVDRFTSKLRQVDVAITAVTSSTKNISATMQANPTVDLRVVVESIAHGFAAETAVLISGCDDPGANGSWIATSVGLPNTFVSPASGAQMLPQATINVSSTVGFSDSNHVTIDRHSAQIQCLP
jgi:hypothetical protein